MGNGREAIVGEAESLAMAQLHALTSGEGSTEAPQARPGKAQAGMLAGQITHSEQLVHSSCLAPQPTAMTGAGEETGPIGAGANCAASCCGKGCW